MNNKSYFKQYYEANREKIIFRVKTNYRNNKFKIKSPVIQEQEIKEIKPTPEKIIVTFK